MSDEKSSQAIDEHTDGALRALPDTSAEYLTPDQAAAVLQVHQKTLKRWAQADPTLPVLRIAGTIRYPRERLLRWLRDREQGRPVGRQPSRNLLLSPPNGASPKASV